MCLVEIHRSSSKATQYKNMSAPLVPARIANPATTSSTSCFLNEKLPRVHILASSPRSSPRSSYSSLDEPIHSVASSSSCLRVRSRNHSTSVCSPKKDGYTSSRGAHYIRSVKKLPYGRDSGEPLLLANAAEMADDTSSSSGEEDEKLLMRRRPSVVIEVARSRSLRRR